MNSVDKRLGRKLRVLILPLSLVVTVLLSSTIVNARPHFSIEEATIHSLQAAIKNKETTCQGVIQSYLDHIKAYNLSVNNNPPINAFTEINPYVMEEARKLDEYFTKHKTLQGSLHCVPVILKDNINTKEMTTTGGSFSLLGNQPQTDAFLVQKLRGAAAILIGKGGMDEFGWGLIGINSRTGRIGNAYDPSKNPGGSSGGVAAAVAANFALVGIGTDNSGSIRIPAAFNGVFGLRPSTGVVSQRGIIPMGNLDAVAGPITRSVTDMALVMDVIANENDPLDPKTAIKTRTQNYTSVLHSGALKDKRIGIVRQIGKIDPFKNFPEEARVLFNESLTRMKNQGAIIFDSILLPEYVTDRMNNQAGEREDVDEYLASFPATRKNFKDVCQSNRTRTFGNAEQCMKFLQKLPAKNSREYQNVLQVFKKNKQYVEAVLKTQNLDVLVLPVTRAGSATYDIYTMNTWIAPLASNAELPSIVINAGIRPSNGLPVGVELISPQYNEDLLLTIAYAYEQHSPKRIAPRLMASQKSFSAYSIAEMNNLFTALGAKTYETVLKEKETSELSPEMFKEIFFQQVKDLAY